MTKTTMKKREIYAMKPLDEAAEPAILSMRVKQRRESIDMFQKGGREEWRR